MKFDKNFVSHISEFESHNQKSHRPCDCVTQQKSEPIYRPFLQSAFLTNYKNATNFNYEMHRGLIFKILTSAI